MISKNECQNQNENEICIVIPVYIVTAPSNVVYITTSSIY